MHAPPPERCLLSGCVACHRLDHRAMKPHPPGAVASLVCGVLSVMTWWLPLIAAPLAIIALVQGRRAQRVTEPDSFQPSGLATAGQVCGAIALAATIIATLVLMALISAIGALGHAAVTAPVPAPHVQRL
jgi:hypothetical protein